MWGINNFTGGTFCGKLQTALLSCWSFVLLCNRGSKIKQVPILRWIYIKEKLKTKKGSELSFIFRVYLPANGACGKKMSNKEVPFPFLAALAAKPCTQRAFIWRTTLTKTAEHNISPRPDKGTALKRRGGAGTYKKQQNSSTAQTPTMSIPLRTGEPGDQCDWFISCC